MSGTVGAQSTQALWYLARGTGMVTLVLITASLVLGIMTSVRWRSEAWPRFVVELLHRNVSLLVLVFLGVHVATVVIDGFAPIGWLDVVIPLASPYRPLWVGLGALSFDLLLAVVVTSLLRQRIGYRVWKAIHWFSYACWPLALVHGMGTGSDTKLGWALALDAVCVAAVVVAVWWRVAVDWPAGLSWRIGALTTSIVAPVLLVVWLTSGPLSPGWTRRAGTPSRLLSTAASGPTSTTARPGSASAQGGLPAPPFGADVVGTIQQSNVDPSGMATIHLALRLTNSSGGSLDIVLKGVPLAGGSGLVMRSSRVALGPVSQPDRFQGQVQSLRGDQLTARLDDPAGTSLDLSASLNPDETTGRANGTIRVVAASNSRQPTGGSGGDGE